MFQDRADDLDEERIVKSATGIRNTVTWKKLYRFQLDGVVGAIDKLKRFGGCIIADSVGLGKTFEALAIIKYHELRNDRVLMLCPKRFQLLRKPPLRPASFSVCGPKALPASTRVQQRIPKKMLVQHAAISATDKRRIHEEIEAVFWEAVFKPATIGVPAGNNDDECGYTEISIIRLVLREGAATFRLA